MDDDSGANNDNNTTGENYSDTLDVEYYFFQTEKLQKIGRVNCGKIAMLLLTRLSFLTLHFKFEARKVQIRNA